MTSPSTAKIILGEPQDEDAFEGEGHKRSSKALVDSIKQLVENGNATKTYGGSIGLEGAWGAGKSSVIRMADKALRAGDTDFVVFTFDMWAHQSDDFRRAFLEELLNFVQDRKDEHKGDDGSFWKNVVVKDERDAVQSRKRTTTDNTKKLYTPLGALMLLLLPLLAIALAWTQPMVFVNPNLGEMSAAPYWAASFLFGVLAVAGAYILYLYFTVDAPDGRIRSRFSRAVSEFFTLSRDVNSQETTQTIREEDPTTSEFRKVFQDLLAKLQSGNRRLIVVLDNVDRLPSGMVQPAWSSMRSLFSARSKKPEHTVLAVVPYERKHVTAAFGLTKTKDEGHDEGQFVPSTENDIFEKTFDRIIRVAPPVPSDWRHYLDARLTEAFESDGLNGIEREKLFRLFKLYLLETRTRVTPRKIIGFVNEIGSLRVQWGAEIPIESLGLYVLHRHDIDDATVVATQIDKIKPSFVDVVDQREWRKHLAALTFNVDTARANQVLFSPSIAQGLTHDDPAKLQEFSKQPGFWEVFQDVLASSLADWSTSDLESIVKAARNVDALAPPEHVAIPAWTTFGNSLKMPSLTEQDLKFTDGLLTIVSHQRPANAVVVASLIESKVLENNKEPSKGLRRLGFVWADLVSKLAEALPPEVSETYNHWQARKPPADPNFAIGIATFCVNRPAPKFDELDLDTTNAQFSEAMKVLITEEPSAYLSAMPLIRGRIEDQSVHLELMAARLQETDDEAVELLGIATEYASGPLEQVRNAFKPLITDGTLAWNALTSFTHGDNGTAARAIFLSLIVDPIQVSVSPKAFNTTFTEVAEAVAWYNDLFEGVALDNDVRHQIAFLINGTQRLSTFIPIAINDPSSHGNFQEILEIAINASPQFLQIVQIVERLPELEGIISDEAIGNLLTNATNTPENIRSKLSGEQIVKVSDEFISTVSGLDGDLAIKTVLTVVDEYLDKIDQTDWQSSLTSAGHNNLRLLLARQESGGPKLSKPDFIAAVTNAAEMILSGTFDPDPIGQRFKLVEDAIPQKSQGQLANLLTPKLKELSPDRSRVEKFIRYFPRTARSIKFNGSDELSKEFLTKIVWFSIGSADPAVRLFLVDMAKKIKESLMTVDDETRSLIDQAIEDQKGDDEEWGAELEDKIAGRKPTKRKRSADVDPKEA